jgi:cytochrome c-type biogenesis protein CcmH
MRKISMALSTMVVLLVVLLAAGIAEAQDDGPTDDEVNAIAKQLFCPVCENVPLDVCPTQACKDWREDIRQKLAAGWSEEQIKQYFVEQHGAQVLAAPPPEGLNLLVYILPPVVIVVGAYVLFRAIRSWRQASTSALPSASPPVSDDPYVAKLEEELRRRSSG